MPERLMIEAAGLVKRYGTTVALAGVDLSVPTGTILGVLGPNGAGKTTAVRILTTLSRADEGWARVAGLDVATQGPQVRKRIGVAAQSTTLDELLTGRQNLVMVGELSGLRRSEAQSRAGQLLDRMELSEAADRLTRGYSGGMRRRLDLAASLIMEPQVLFLDEPTTGLDPVSRLAVWEVVREMVGRGCTVLLTTQYLDEADHLADRIAVFDHGRVIAVGTAQELKSATGAARLEVTLTHPRPEAVLILRPLLDADAHLSHDGRRLRAPVRSQDGLATAAVRVLDGAGILVDDVQVHQPSLDDVFFALTGHAAEEAVEMDEAEVPA